MTVLLHAALLAWLPSVSMAAELRQAPDLDDKTLIDDTAERSLIPAYVKARGRVTGWVRQSASLLFYDETGGLANETPLRSDEELAGSRANVREIMGGASSNGRFGWTLERQTAWNQSRSKVFSSKRLLRVFGSNGKELWNSSEADVPENGDPLTFSSDGETLIVALHSPSGWSVSVKNYMGASLIDVGPVPRLQAMMLTPNGKYAMARWIVPDQSATHTFLEVATKRRQDIPSSELALGTARIAEDGKVYSGKKLVFDFATPAKKP